MPLIKRASANEPIKSGLPTPPRESPPPPAYTEDGGDHGPDITAAFSNLNLKETSADTPTSDQCTAHLKLLEAFHQLREDVALHDGLFGIKDDNTEIFVSTNKDPERARIERLTQIREKRWAVFVAKAAHRFEHWWQVCVQPESKPLIMPKIPQAFLVSPSDGPRLRFDEDHLPPLDVIMVWHAYQLNPRDFLEDCLRFGKLDFWRAGFPWASVDKCIDNMTFEFKGSRSAEEYFTTSTGLPWDSQNEPEENKVIMPCPRCTRPLTVSWTTCGVTGQSTKRANSKQHASGLADKDFQVSCESCLHKTDHDLLKLQKFGRAIEDLRHSDVPLPGTLLSINGTPQVPISLGRHPSLFPNRLILGGGGRTSDTGLYRKLYAISRNPSEDNPMNDVKNEIEIALKSKTHIKLANNTFTARLTVAERVAVRRMMAHFWDNHSPFGLDLVGAVIRQSSFIEKMHSIDWIHSPASSSTMQRLITKYTRYIEIIAMNPREVAVPTLDVDLAWHTHQLSPTSYYQYTIGKTRKFIDHDDKIEEVTLSNAFEWTSKTYERRFNEVYSECTCWYCEAIRESHTSSMKRLVGGTSNIDSETDKLHKVNGDQPGAHISAHSSIKPDSKSEVKAQIRQDAYNRKLESSYQKAVRRAQKKGRAPPSRDEYTTAYTAYGYPMMVPYYAPYMGDPCVTSDMYASNPSCANFTPGAAGNCAAGSCGGGVAAGACAGAANGAGGCAGGGLGSCGAGASGGGGGGFGGGACGGGGGGGCGGGGGGGGCGGGGGG